MSSMTRCRGSFVFSGPGVEGKENVKTGRASEDLSPVSAEMRPYPGRTKALQRGDGGDTHGVTGLNRSVARALQVLLEVARAEKPLGFMDLYKRLKLPKGTLHKLLYTLETLTFLRRDEDSGKYSTGLAVLELNARGLAKPGDLRSILDPILHQLVETWDESLVLCVYDDGEEIILDRLDPPYQVVRVTTEMGRRHPAYATSGGLAAMALLPEKAAFQELPAKLRTLTKNTVKTRKALRARLQEVKAKGYAVDMEEAYVGVRCVGIAVSVPGWPIVTVSFTLPLQRAAIERMQMLSQPLLQAAREIERALARAVSLSDSR